MAATALAMATAACAAGTPESNCREFLEIFDDLRAGRVRDGRELGRRLLRDIGEFPEGTRLRASYDRLVDQIDAGDERKVAEEMTVLADECREVLGEEPSSRA